MRTKGNSADFVRPNIILPDGKYSGVWSGYFVVVNVPSSLPAHWLIHTENGVRGINIPCTVSVSNGEITVESGE